MARFACLEHDWPQLHVDFLLEIPVMSDGPHGLSWTWRLPHAAVHKEWWGRSHELDVEQIAAHRNHYLTYSGPVTPAADGTSRGVVRQVMQGEYQLLEPAAHGLRADSAGGQDLPQRLVTLLRPTLGALAGDEVTVEMQRLPVSSMWKMRVVR